MNFKLFGKGENTKKNHTFLHAVWKSKIFIPWMKFFRKTLKKLMVTKREDIPDTPDISRKKREVQHFLPKQEGGPGKWPGKSPTAGTQ